jgi:voltage-gated potassium channel
LAARAATLFALLGLVMIVFWLDRDGLRDFADGHVSFADVVYFTMVTVTTVGYGDIVPVTGSARLFDALLVTPVRLLVWLIFIGTAYQFVVERILEDTRMRLRQSRLKDHIVICGFGRSGRSAACQRSQADRAGARRPDPNRSSWSRHCAAVCEECARAAKRRIRMLGLA